MGAAARAGSPECPKIHPGAKGWGWLCQAGGAILACFRQPAPKHHPNMPCGGRQQRGEHPPDTGPAAHTSGMSLAPLGTAQSPRRVPPSLRAGGGIPGGLTLAPNSTRGSPRAPQALSAAPRAPVLTQPSCPWSSARSRGRSTAQETRAGPQGAAIAAGTASPSLCSPLGRAPHRGERLPPTAPLGSASCWGCWVAVGDVLGAGSG